MDIKMDLTKISKRTIIIFVSVVLVFAYLISTEIKLKKTGAPIGTFLFSETKKFKVSEFPAISETTIKQQDNISAIIILRKDNSVELLPSGSVTKNDPHHLGLNSLRNDFLQILSTSSTAYAANCSAGQHEECAGPGWFNGKYYGRTCWCAN